MNADLLTILHALEKCLEDCLFNDGMEIVGDDPNIPEIVRIDNKERIQELDLAIKALHRLVG